MSPEQQWPSMPGAHRPCTSPSTDPLAPAHRKTLAPQPMPGGEDPLDADATVNVTRTAPELPIAAPGDTTDCATCGATVRTWESFCESCGVALTPTAVPPPTPEPDGSRTATVESKDRSPDSSLLLSQPASPTCRQCGGIVGPDLYCTMCGAKAAPARDHFTEEPASWVAGCCDRGIRHAANEDAMALAAYDKPGSRAILVVCDGVSSSDNSAVAALAAARAVRDGLLAATPAGHDPDPAMGQAFAAATARGNEAVIEHTAPDAVNAAACTLTAAVIYDGTVYWANVGDSRVYWIDDDPTASAQLTVDDSMAQAHIHMGMSTDAAEAGPGAHIITKWLGNDATDIVPSTGQRPLPERGWLVACSDGLWNYASAAPALAEVVHTAANGTDHCTPVELVEALVAWACEQGGRDNVTVALARIGSDEVVTRYRRGHGSTLAREGK